jgi:hypothetical protein
VALLQFFLVTTFLTFWTGNTSSQTNDGSGA